MEDKTLTIAQLVKNLPRLRVHEEALEEYEKHTFYSTIPVVDKPTYLGIEVEVENVTRGIVSPYWQMVDDGSLRNRGREFITHPIRAFRAETALRLLFEGLNSDVDFSERTSIHVHMNIRTLSLEQLQSLILVYLIFEDNLFNFIGHDRRNNIFCTPLLETNILQNLRSFLHEKNRLDFFSWYKYTAMNLVPIAEKGTIEFRHHYGTNDIKQILTWINILLSLKKFALRVKNEQIWETIKTLNTNSQYRVFALDVFGDLTDLVWSSSSNTGMEKAISQIKGSCIKNPFAVDLVNSVSYTSALAKACGIKDKPKNVPDTDVLPGEEWPENPINIFRYTLAAPRYIEAIALRIRDLRPRVIRTIKEAWGFDERTQVFSYYARVHVEGDEIYQYKIVFSSTDHNINSTRYFTFIGTIPQQQEINPTQSINIDSFNPFITTQTTGETWDIGTIDETAPPIEEDTLSTDAVQRAIRNVRERLERNGEPVIEPADQFRPRIPAAPRNRNR